MKKFFLILAIVVGVLIALGVVFRGELQFMAMMAALQPDASFAEDVRHPAPQYDNPQHWAALPDRDDLADSSPTGMDLDNQSSAPVDVFFIHPTTYINSDHWNQPLESEETNQFTDNQVMRGQASAFNGCCRVYAPRYRQATLFSFMDDGTDGPAAIDYAYQDVKRAFEYYLQHFNQGRPFIIAGHSQGAKHADTLMADMIANTPLQKQMVAAYPVGYFLDGSNGIPVCSHATETGCQVTWNSLAPDAPSFRDASNDLCVNPLNWSSDGSYADFSLNTGGVNFNADGLVEPGLTDAQCESGRLHISEVRSEHYSSQLFGPGNYHVYDFSFFYMNIRSNAQARTIAYLAANSSNPDAEAAPSALN